MNTDNLDITIPLNDVRHLFLKPDCDPLNDKNLTISGLEYIFREMRMKPLPKKIKLHLLLSKRIEDIKLENVQESFRRYCQNIIHEKEEDLRYLNWKIERSFIRSILPFLLVLITIGSIMYHWMDDQSRFVKTLLMLLNNGVIIIGWVILWIPAEMFLYDAPYIKNEIALYGLLADAELNISAPNTSASAPG